MLLGILKYPIIAKKGNEEILLTPGTVVKEIDSRTYTTGNLNGTGKVQLIFTFKATLLKRKAKVINNKLERVLIKQEYTFQVKQKFLKNFIDKEYTRKNKLILEINEKLENEYNKMLEVQ